MADATQTNPQAFKALGDRLDAFDKVTGKVGWFESAVYPDGTPVAYAAAINELGSPANNIPSRSFMRSTALEKDGAWKDLASTISKKILAGEMTPQDGMELLALQAEGDIAKKIASITSPPLSPITLGVRKYKSQGKTITGATIGEIARKLHDGTLDVSGVSDKPLVDTSLMVDTLTHKVEG